MRSLYEELTEVQDIRRSYNIRYPLASALSVYILAMLSNRHGYYAAAEFASELDQEELQAVGSWYNKKTGRYVPISKSTLHRILQIMDPEILEEIFRRYRTPRIRLARTLAADSQHFRRAAQNEKTRYESAGLIDQATSLALSVSNLNDQQDENSSLCELLQKTKVQGTVISFDAIHSSRNTARLIKGTHDADYFIVIKDNSTETRTALDAVN